MAEDFSPRSITRADLASFLPNNRAIRAFEKLFETVIDPGSAPIFTSVNDITQPVELRNIEKDRDGFINIVYSETEFTIYCFSATQIAENIPYVVSGKSGSWIATGGRYLNSDFNVPTVNTNTINAILGFIETLDSTSIYTDLLDTIQAKVSYADFDLAPTALSQEGRLKWNADDGALESGLPGGNVNLQIGFELLVKVVNKTGALIPNGAAVSADGAQGSRPTVRLAQANNEATAVPFIGLATEDIADNNSGYVCVQGLVRDVDTSAFTEGSILYLSAVTAGQYTSTLPSAPSWKIGVGVCLYSHADNGIIGVLPRVNPNLNRLQDVNLTSLIDRNLMVYNASSQRWENAIAWKDIQFSIATAKLPAANVPTWSAFTASLYKFTYAINDYSFLESNEISHSYIQGTDVTVHCHIYTNGIDTTDRTVAYELVYAITNRDNVATEVTVVSPDFTIPANIADRTHLYVPIATITGTNFLMGADITLRFRRVAASAGTAPTNDPFVSMVGMHIRQDFHGSRNELSK